jgi:hypothetical protein
MALADDDPEVVTTAPSLTEGWARLRPALEEVLKDPATAADVAETAFYVGAALAYNLLVFGGPAGAAALDRDLDAQNDRLSPRH